MLDQIEETIKILRGDSPAVCDVCGYEATPVQIKPLVVTMCADGVKRCQWCADKAFRRYHPPGAKAAQVAP